MSSSNPRDRPERCTFRSASAAVALLIHLACGAGSTPTAPTTASSTLLATGDYRLHVVALPRASGCTGTAAVPVMDGTILVTLEVTSRATLLGSVPAGRGDLTVRLVESDRAVPGFATLTGTAQGVALAVPGTAAAALRFAGTQLRGTAVASGASGDLAGPLVFEVPGEADVTCTSARWSMGRVQP